VLIEGTTYTITDMGIEIFASTMTRRLNEFQHGEVSPCDAQLLITIDPEA
jgi:hypothetical protein